MYHEDFTYVEYSEGDLVRYMWWYHVVGLIWTSEFILACQQMVVAGAVTTWYFTRLEHTSINCFHNVSIAQYL